MINALTGDAQIIKEKIKSLIDKGMYGEAVKTIDSLNSEIKNNVMYLSDDDGWFLCGLQSGLCCEDCGNEGGWTCCGCALCGIGIIATCFGMNCAESICDFFTDGAVNCTEKLCCNDCFC